MEKLLVNYCIDAVNSLYGKKIDAAMVQIQETKKEFEGEYTLVVFPLLKVSGKSPVQTSEEIGRYLVDNLSDIESFNVVKGFLNLSLSSQSYLRQLNRVSIIENFGFSDPCDEPEKILIEYSSPNTNKPLHLGHIRNNLLGYSLSRILKANGKEVYKTNIVNDRGIHICKSMLAWKLYGDGETPESTGEKGDHLVGKYYVRFDREYKKQQEELIRGGMTADEAAIKADLIVSAREMLRMWESGDHETVDLWKKMNSWVYKGFDQTYSDLGVDFDKIYYESDTFKHGKEIISDALTNNKLIAREDGSVWADLSDDGLDEKLLLRSDGTAVYMTQDLGTAVERYNDYKFDRQLYVVGNEQNYHFQVLTLILKKLGYSWAEGIFHYSYGMVELPEGKMKSREGTIVDADDLIAEMIRTAGDTSDELGKLDDYAEEERHEIYRKVGLGALKYFILKVDPKKNMMFNPAESIDFNGNTGPFIQYTYARINSIMRKSDSIPEAATMEVLINKKEKGIVIALSKFPAIVSEAGENLSPALIANYCYELSRDFNQFYHDYSILNESDKKVRDLRILITALTGKILEKGMWLLGIEMPERM